MAQGQMHNSLAYRLVEVSTQLDIAARLSRAFKVTVQSSLHCVVALTCSIVI